MTENNPDFELAFHIVEHTDTNLFLTGRAGTGKTTFLRSLIKTSSKRMVVAAPTGIAAINAGGLTLHSLFQLDFGPFIPEAKRKPLKFNRDKLRLIRFMDVLVIDEISMVRADLLDAVDAALRRLRNPYLPFGGVQLLLIGDLRQLPPVITEEERLILADRYSSPYFFASNALAQTNYVTIELQKVYRQEDAHFLNLLNGIREGQPSPHIIKALNTRYIPDFHPDTSKSWIRLTTHNTAANAINRERMSSISSSPFTYKAVVKGNFPEIAYPADKTLILKKGAQVMFIKNDPSADKEFYNGMLGTVTCLAENTVCVKPANGKIEITVSPLSWENRKFSINEQTGELQESIEGTFSQMPLKPAWAITIHKSQGLTFDHAIIDASASFAHGQTYVALSRCRTLEGLVLSAPIPSHAIISDPHVSHFLSVKASQKPDNDALLLMGKQYSLHLLDSLFDFSTDMTASEDIHKLVADAFHTTYPSLVADFGNALKIFNEQVSKPSATFRRQYYTLTMTPDSLPQLTERLCAAAGYFPDKINAFLRVLNRIPQDHDNKNIKKRLLRYVPALSDSLSTKTHLIGSLRETPFSPESLLKCKAKYLLQLDRNNSKNTDVASRSARSAKASLPSEIKHKQLFNILNQWRRTTAKEQGVPSFRILSTKALIALSNKQPSTRAEFLDTPGCGPKTADLYADTVIALINKHKDISISSLPELV